MSEMMGHSLTVVVPAFNEAESLPVFLPQLIEHCDQKGWKIIVVDDGSTDATFQVLSAYEANEHLEILRHKVNRGYGGALKTGIGQADTDFVVTIDADGQHGLFDIQAMLAALLDVDADMVIGKRIYQESPNLYRAIGKWLIRRFTRLLVALSIEDLNSGFKLYNTHLVQQYLHLCPDSMAFSDVITLIFVSRRYLVIEHPIQVKRRLGGKSTINTRTAFETLFEILNVIMMFNPMRIFLPASLLCILAGVVWGIPIVLMGRGVSVGAMLAIVTGVLFLFIGLVAQQMSLIRQENAVLFSKLARHVMDTRSAERAPDE
jgi:glycosyltransferase involved in cell wall biosynthesis